LFSHRIPKKKNSTKQGEKKGRREVLKKDRGSGTDHGETEIP